MIPSPDLETIDDTDEIVDLTNTDLDDTVYIYSDNWKSYLEELYVPKDLNSGSVQDSARISLGNGDPVYKEVEYATHVAELKLPPGKSYGIYMKSADYAMRIFIDGAEVDKVGNPSENEKENIPRVAIREYFFTPSQSITQIVIQVSNHVHVEGSYPPAFTIGYDDTITEYSNEILMVSFMMIGALFTAFLYHLGLFVLNHKQRSLLYFSLSCFLLMLLSNKLIPALYPDYSWDVAIRIEYIVHFATFLVLTLFLRTLFPYLIKKILAYAYYIVGIIYIVSTLILPSKIFTSLIMYFDIISIPFIIYVITRLVLTLKEKRLQNHLAFTGMAVVSLAAIYDILNKNGLAPSIGIPGQDFITPVAMLFFVFCYTLVLSMDYADMGKTVALAEQQIADAETRYELLQKTNKKMLPNTTLSDLGLSRRETDVAYLLIDGKMRSEIVEILDISMGSVNTYCSRIYHKAGCKSMSEFLKILGLPDNIRGYLEGDHNEDQQIQG